MARRKKPEEHVNHERWLVSYADFITLLFAFFTSMYAISTVDAAKAGKMVFSTRAAFNLGFFSTAKPVLGQPPPKGQESFLPEEKIMQQIRPAVPKLQEPRPRWRATPSNVRSLAHTLEKYVTRADLDQLVQVRVEQRRIVVSMAAAVLFRPGATTIRRESYGVLHEIAEILLPTGHHVSVEGHTDDDSAPRNRRSSNWTLSTGRAVAVVAHLIEEFAFPAELLSAAGFASYRPVASNETEAGRAENRRVDLVLEFVPQPEENAAPTTESGGQ